jgi:hypothetical protein
VPQHPILTWLLVVVPLLTGCTLGYRIEDSEIENRRFRIASNQQVSERDPTGSLAPVQIDAELKGIVYVVHDTVYFDEAESTRTLALVAQPTHRTALQSTIKLSRTSFQADVITIPLRYRFPRGTLGGTMPESTNLAVYGGVRFEDYRLEYSHHRQGTTRETRRIGYGCGPFVGLTPVAVGADVDLPAIMMGAGAMLDVGGVSFGLALGVDHLLQKPHADWHYEGALWTGLWVGLQLN